LEKSLKKSIGSSDFQSVIDGKKTDLFTIRSRDIEITITNWGGRVVSILAPDREGNIEDIVLGFDNIKDYQNADEMHYGAIIGRYANRIANGQFKLNGQKYKLDKNSGKNHLHGGSKGFHNVVWSAKKIDDQHLLLYYYSKDMEQGYPANLNVQVVYSLNNSNELKIEYSAFSDGNTIVNLTNHTFFNLAGANGSTINNHELLIRANKYTPVDENSIPLGHISKTKGTPFDFTTSTPIGERLNENHIQLKNTRGYDQNYVLNKSDNRSLTLAASVREPKSGRTLQVLTTEPCMQFYGGNYLNGRDTGKQNIPHYHRTAFCLEPQHYPDSPNQENFPSRILTSDSYYYSLSVYRFLAS